jgi:hypothetical protein
MNGCSRDTYKEMESDDKLNVLYDCVVEINGRLDAGQKKFATKQMLYWSAAGLVALMGVCGILPDESVSKIIGVFFR